MSGVLPVRQTGSTSSRWRGSFNVWITPGTCEYAGSLSPNAPLGAPGAAGLAAGVPAIPGSSALIFVPFKELIITKCNTESLF